MEATLRATLHNVLAHFGMEDGDPSLEKADITLFITSPSPGSELRTALSEALRRAPLYQTFNKAGLVNTRLVIQ